MFDRTDGKSVRESLHREWLDDIKDWHGMELQLVGQTVSCVGTPMGNRAWTSKQMDRWTAILTVVASYCS